MTSVALSNARIELFSRIRNRLTTFHINEELEVERCSLGEFCFGGEHFDSLEAAEEFLAPGLAAGGLDALDRGAVNEALYAIDLALREARRRQSMLVKLLASRKKFDDILGKTAHVGMVRAAARALWDGTDEISLEDFAKTAGCTMSVAMIYISQIIDVGLARKLPNDDGSEARFPQQTDLTFHLYSVTIGRIEAYTAYLEELGILTEMMENPRS